MRNYRFVSLFILTLFLTLIVNVAFSQSMSPDVQVIEDFDDGDVELESYSNEDEEPQAWGLNSEFTYNNSAWSLKLFGNTWKLQQIEPVAIDTGDVWQVSAYIASPAEVQGFGVSDGENVLYYAFAGTEEMDPEIWVPVYQGNFPEDQWNNYLLPLADDWMAYFGYLPEISQIIYISDKDNTSQGVVYFDQIVNISDDLPISPKPTISYDKDYSSSGKSVQVQFSCEVDDPDSETHEFLWDFGDGSTSIEQDPMHNFIIEDEHPYTVLLRVKDETMRWGAASCKIEVESGSSSLPVSLNFVGDIMMARKYEYNGGIIPTQGVEALFEPTKAILGDTADITIANLECPLTTYWEHHPTKSIYYKGSPQNVAGLTYAGIDIVTLANNHILDYMLPGMQETQSILDQNNILHSGAGADTYEASQPVFYSKSGINFAFLASSDRTGQYNNYQPYLNAGYNKSGFASLEHYYIKKQIDEVKDISDLVVMEWHTGVEYSTNPGSDVDLPFANDVDQEEGYSPLAIAPTRSNREIRQYAVDNGADLVICHHPHIMQAVELYHGKLIAHSLGDFVFDLDYPETFPSYILNVEADETGFSRFTLTPIYIDDYIPQPALGELGLYILDDLAQGSKNLSTYLKVDRENGFAEVMMDTLNMSTVYTDYTVALSLAEVNGFWESPPLAIEHEGSLSSVNFIKPAGNYEFRLGREKIWFGNMEDEGCSLWNLNSDDETFCDTVAFAGTRSIQHQRTPDSPYNIITNFEKRIICRSDTLKYSLSGYIKTLNGADVTIEVRYYEDRTGGIAIGQENVGTFVNGDTPWAYYHNDLSIPEGTEFFDIRLNSDHPQEGIALSWFDDVSLVCWDSWGAYDIGGLLPVPNDYYFIQAKSEQNQDKIEISYSESVFEEIVVGVDDAATEVNPTNLLQQNSPNPFNPANGPSKISFHLDKPSKIELCIYDMSGRKVKVLVADNFETGNHAVHWDGKNEHGAFVKSGVYLYQLETQNHQQIKKCIVFNL